MDSSCSMVMSAMSGCAGELGVGLATVSVRESFPSSMSWRMIVAVNVLVTLPIRNTSSTVALRPPTTASPHACV